MKINMQIQNLWYTSKGKQKMDIHTIQIVVINFDDPNEHVKKTLMSQNAIKLYCKL